MDAVVFFFVCLFVVAVDVFVIVFVFTAFVFASVVVVIVVAAASVVSDAATVTVIFAWYLKQGGPKIYDYEDRVLRRNASG